MIRVVRRAQNLSGKQYWSMLLYDVELNKTIKITVEPKIACLQPNEINTTEHDQNIMCQVLGDENNANSEIYFS